MSWAATLARRMRRPSPGASEPGFAYRHRFLLVLVLVQVPVLATVGLLKQVPVSEVVVASLIVVVLALVGMVARRRTLASAAVALGLVIGSGALVRYLDGSIASTFVFFLAIVAISFYRDWKPLLAGFVYVAGYQVFAAITLYREDLEGGVSWPWVQLALTLVLMLLLMAGWRLTDRLEARHKSQEAGYRAGFERATVGLAILTPSGDFIRANPALTQLIGAGDLAGSNIRAVVHPDDIGDLGQAWEEIGRFVNETMTTGLRCRTAHGQAFWGRMSLTFVPGARRQMATVLLELGDDTRADREHGKLQALNRAHDDFVAAVAEEIRVPIGSVLDLTAAADADPVDLHQIVRSIEAETRRAATLVDDLMVSARADTVSVSAVPRSIDAALLCRETLADLPGAEEIPIEHRGGALWADPGLTSRIISTLVSNALGYGGSGVRLVCARSGPDTVIEVIDDGPAVPAPERESVFDADLPDGRPTTKPVAVGLGLSVARRLARQMDGDLAYRRTANGLNVFELRLPSEQVRPTARPLPLGIPA